MKDKIFGVLQRVGRSFMLPIALLPVAGLLLGIGSSFTNETMLAAYGLNNVIHPGTLIYTILDVMSQTGNAVFSNLALLFAMGVAIGMARKEKEVAALSGAVAYIKEPHNHSASPIPSVGSFRLCHNPYTRSKSIKHDLNVLRLRLPLSSNTWNSFGLSFFKNSLYSLVSVL